MSLNANLEDAISDLLMSNGTEQCPDRKSFKTGIYSDSKSKYQSYLRKGISKNKIPDSHRFVNHSKIIIERFQLFLKTETRNRTVSDKTKIELGLKKRTQIPLFGKLPAPTITTLPDDYVHYLEPRILTVREYARIQSFPDSYEFKGKYTTGGKKRVLEVPRYTQIGNAIPPLFGEQSGIILMNLLTI